MDDSLTFAAAMLIVWAVKGLKESREIWRRLTAHSGRARQNRDLGVVYIYKSLLGFGEDDYDS